jgi:hypothetical protein
MKRETADIASAIIDRINKLERTILELQNITNYSEYSIVSKGFNGRKELGDDIFDRIEVKLDSGTISNTVFSQDILEYFINTLNLELEEEEKKLEDLN